ncbi:Low-specificity L-threonine aldolase [Staphylococcus gallinarum]|uniref:Low-specificity L-threonine aldolase n=1 Tax=Staphylococcus gallinarum TaxID=1293 RepID=A0A380FHN2_STAGA|nr:Low-specificity L-threonine aldolase [Staphylococcus gallinarum]
MISFENDYLEGAHEKVLARLIETNMVQESGYGTDSYTKQAQERIKEVIGLPTAEVQLLTGGTQTNQIVIDTMLEPYQGVLAADTGHISTHEAGAIEFTGKKVLTLPSSNGKLSAESVKDYIEVFYNDANHDHMVFPGMVYISFPTEYGTLYSKQELEQLSAVCKAYQIPLFIDGARLGYGLASDYSDVTIADIAQLSDVFYIGGTKIGALCGEAVVFTSNNMPKHFVTRIKQHGALLAKGRLLGVQFLELFTDNLYFEISQHAIKNGSKIKNIICKQRLSTVYRLINKPTIFLLYITIN